MGNGRDREIEFDSGYIKIPERVGDGDGDSEHWRRKEREGSSRRERERERDEASR